jgi:hypothetical protein
MDAALSTDAIGYAAALATLMTFAQRRMVPMRLFAVGANLLFISYSLLGAFYPVAILHLILLPLNVLRLAEHLRLFTARLARSGAQEPLVAAFRRNG